MSLLEIVPSNKICGSTIRQALIDYRQEKISLASKFPEVFPNIDDQIKNLDAVLLYLHSAKIVDLMIVE